MSTEFEELDKNEPMEDCAKNNMKNPPQLILTGLEATTNACKQMSSERVERNKRIREFVKAGYLKGYRAKEILDTLNGEQGERVCRATVERWLRNFKSGKLSIDDKPKPGRRPIAQPDTIRETIEQDPLISVAEIYCLYNLGRTTITAKLSQLLLTNVNKMWVPKSPSPELLDIRLTMCRSLMNRQEEESESFLDRVIFEGERVIYYNVNWKRQPKDASWEMRDRMPRKLIFQLWWDRQGLIAYKLREEKERWTAETYEAELRRLVQEMTLKRPNLLRLYIHHNSTDYLSQEINEFIAGELGWEQILQPKLCPDISPTNYCVFQYLQYAIQMRVLTKIAEVEDVVSKFFDKRNGRNAAFFRKAVDEWPGRWAKIVERQGAYIETNEKEAR